MFRDRVGNRARGTSAPGAARRHPSAWLAPRRLLLSVPLLAFACTPAAAADSLTVAQCVALARARAPEVESLAAEARAARHDSTGTSANGRPAWSLSGGALLAPAWSYDPVATNLGEYSMRLGVSLPLRDGGERGRARGRAGLAAASVSAARDLASRDAGLRAATLALGLTRVRELDDASAETLQWLEHLSELLESGVRAGVRDRADAVRMRLEHDGVESERLAREAEREALGLELGRLIGVGGVPAIAPIAADSESEVTPSLDDSLALVAAIESSADLRVARSAVAESEFALDEAHRRNATRVDLSADAGLWGTDLTHAVPEDFALTHPGADFGDRLRRDLGASLALQFHRPLFDPASAPGERAAEERRVAAQRRLDAALAERHRVAEELFARWNVAARRLALARGSLARAEENVLRMRSRYAGGAATLLELLDARQQWDDARARIADARLESRLAHWEGELLR
jgi:outer membrane protein TolC